MNQSIIARGNPESSENQIHFGIDLKVGSVEGPSAGAIDPNEHLSVFSLPVEALTLDDWNALKPKLHELAAEAQKEASSSGESNLQSLKERLAEKVDNILEKFDWTDVIDGYELVESAATYLDRAGELTPEHDAIAMELGASETGLSENTVIDAYTTRDQLKEVAKQIGDSLLREGTVAYDVEDALAQKQEGFQENDDQWGEMTPYLEELLAEGHPNLRLKTAGKYNPEGRRILLIRTRHGDGGWEPAAIDEGSKAFEQWHKAGLEYPFKDRRDNQRAKDVVSHIEKRIEHHASSASRSTVTEALAQHRKLTRQLEEAQEAIKQLVPVIRENNLEEAEIQVRIYRDELQRTATTAGALKLRKALIDAVLKAIAADQQVDTQHPDYLPFARTASMIELGIGRTNTKEALEKDAERLKEAAGVSRALLNHLHDDSTGRELKPVLERALTLAEGGTPD